VSVRLREEIQEVLRRGERELTLSPKTHYQSSHDLLRPLNRSSDQRLPSARVALPEEDSRRPPGCKIGKR
jgi:hypothetical protein